MDATIIMNAHPLIHHESLKKGIHPFGSQQVLNIGNEHHQNGYIDIDIILFLMIDQYVAHGNTVM